MYIVQVGSRGSALFITHFICGGSLHEGEFLRCSRAANAVFHALCAAESTLSLSLVSLFSCALFVVQRARRFLRSLCPSVSFAFRSFSPFFLLFSRQHCVLAGASVLSFFSRGLFFLCRCTRGFARYYLLVFFDEFQIVICWGYYASFILHGMDSVFFSLR